jgi:cobalt-precorrin-5B (C1)-methyltransferase
LGDDDAAMADPPSGPLRRGWTTGTCAAAAARAAHELLVTGECPAMVEVVLPNGARPSFAVATFERGNACASAGVVKDAGDDPDVTHGALIKAKVSAGVAGSGITFRAGPGVGTVTKPGLPVPPGEPAINPIPRAMIRQALGESIAARGTPADVVVEISIPDGEELAKKTLNGRLGIVGGLSILGTTGIVVPFSCAAWIHSIHRGIDVARATGIRHIAGATGSTSEAAAQKLFGLSEAALIDMGDFVGGMLKYLKRNPVPRVTIAGGFAKMVKLGQGLLDLHSKRGEIDREWLAARLIDGNAPAPLVEFARTANTAQLVLEEARRAAFPLGDIVADAALRTASRVIEGTGIALDVAVFDRQGQLVGQAPAPSSHAPLPR